MRGRRRKGKIAVMGGITGLLLTVIAMGFFPGSGEGRNTGESTGAYVESQDIRDGKEEMEVHFLDVGQGDCTLIRCGGEAMLIDAGDNEQGTKIQSYLQNHGVDDLKYVVCTHPDEDHIGGIDVILYKFDCDTILMTEEEKDTDTYRDVVNTMADKGYQRTLPVTGQQYSLGDAIFTIVGPASTGSDSNNNSISLVLEHGENRFLFTGDAEEEEEEDILGSGISLDVDIYKAGHHGSRTSSSENLLAAASPLYAVISCGEGNSYGHPHAETLNHFRSMGVKVYRTDEQGSIVVTSDGSALSWNCSPSESWQAGEPTGSAASPETVPEPESEAEAPGTPDYVCNTNTMKFHLPDCSSVAQMEEENKLPTNAAKEELMNQGYAPCNKCNP